MTYMSYVLEKARAAAITMVSGGEDIDGALAAAAMELSLLKLEEMPASIREAHARIIRGLTAAPIETSEGAIRDTLTVVPSSRKRHLAEYVVTFYGDVSWWCGANEGSSEKTEHMGATPTLPPAIYWEFLDWQLGSVPTAEEKKRYIAYAKVFLPNFPDDVISEWIGRHVHSALSEWAHLGFERFSFAKERWPMEKIQTIQPRDRTFSEVGPSSHGGGHLRSLKGNWLVEFMRSNGTWPVPIVVLENRHSLRDGTGRPLPEGFVLVEGHRRFAYVVNLAALGLAKQEHDVWLLRIDRKLSASSLTYVGE